MRCAGLVACLLWGKAEVDDVHEYLCVALGLEVSAHDAERKDGLIVFSNEGGDDCVEGSFVGLEFVVVVRVERKEQAAVLQGEAEIIWYDLRAEAVVGTLDE